MITIHLLGQSVYGTFFCTPKVESEYDDLLKFSRPLFEDTEKITNDFIKYYNNERIQQKLG